ncbi:MAG: hypothetical protein H5T78_25230 [Nocardia sp.]|nr:hypothetical protein [Nocardia sp.]
MIGNVVLGKIGLRDRLSAGFRTEFFIRPIVAFGSAVVVNLAVGLGLSVLLFRDFAV